jgi:hypothetical protein
MGMADENVGDSQQITRCQGRQVPQVEKDGTTRMKKTQIKEWILKRARGGLDVKCSFQSQTRLSHRLVAIQHLELKRIKEGLWKY